MRFGTLMVALVVAGPLPATLRAQKAFEGIITWGSTLSGGRGNTTIRVKGSKVRTDAGDEKRGTFTTIKDENGRILMLMPPRKMYYVMANVQGLVTPKKYEPTGRSETVAGYPCKYYRVVDASAGGQHNEEVCVTTALGFVPIGAGGPMPDAAARAVHEQFRDGFMILKTSRNGRDVEVLKVEPTTLSDALFAPPADYTEVKMPGSLKPGS